MPIPTAEKSQVFVSVMGFFVQCERDITLQCKAIAPAAQHTLPVSDHLLDLTKPLLGQISKIFHMLKENELSEFAG